MDRKSGWLDPLQLSIQDHHTIAMQSDDFIVPRENLRLEPKEPGRVRSANGRTTFLSRNMQDAYCESRSGILAAVGGTPLVQLHRLIDHAPFQLYAKLEMCNPVGSVKDRPALNMLRQALARGDVNRTTTIIESSSGNLGIGLAQACAYYDLRFICVVDPKTTAQNVRILNAYGVQVEMIDEPDPATGDFLPARLARVQHLCTTMPNSYWINQYANYDNAAAHHHTMREIIDALGNAPDYFICSTGTCGTIRGSIGQVLNGTISARVNDGKRVIYSPFGLGVLDLALGGFAYELAVTHTMGTMINSFLPEPWLERRENEID